MQTNLEKTMQLLREIYIAFFQIILKGKSVLPITKIKVSLYDDLYVDLEDVFNF